MSEHSRSVELRVTVWNALQRGYDAHNKRSRTNRIEMTDADYLEDIRRVLWYTGLLPPEEVDPRWQRTTPLDDIAEAVELTVLQRLQLDWMKRNHPELFAKCKKEQADESYS